MTSYKMWMETVITIACVCDESSAVGGKLLQLQIHLCLSKSITKYYLEVTLCNTLYYISSW